MSKIWSNQSWITRITSVKSENHRLAAESVTTPAPSTYHWRHIISNRKGGNLWIECGWQEISLWHRMNLIIWWLNHMKRCIVVPTGCEYMLWGPRAEIVDDAAKTVGRCGGLLIKNLGQLEDVTLRLFALCMTNGGPSTCIIVCHRRVSSQHVRRQGILLIWI